MFDRIFLQKLKKELPVWVEKEFIKEEKKAAILSYYEEGGGAGHYQAYALGILGVALLGSGVISFFAANWSAMSKISRLLVLSGAFFVNFFFAWRLSPGRDGKGFRSEAISQSLNLLAVILFGSNIMLIAQMYHIQSHFPDGILLWACGGILVTFLLQSQPAAIATLLLLCLWTGMETEFLRSSIHWKFLIPFTFTAWMAHRNRWRVAGHFVTITLLFWLLLTFMNTLDNILKGDQNAVFLLQLYFLLFFLLQSAASLLSEDSVLRISRLYFLLSMFFCFYMLTFPSLNDVAEYMKRSGGTHTHILLKIFLGVSLPAGVLFFMRRHQLGSSGKLFSVLAAGAAATYFLLLLNFFAVFPAGILGLLMNLLYFAILVGLVFAGFQQREKFIVNLAYFYFALGVISRYFDTFWKLLDRSFFFIAGGLLLILGGYWLERSRRKIMAAFREGGES